MTRISSLEGLSGMPPGIRWEEFHCAIVEAPDWIDCLDLAGSEDHALTATYPRGLAFGDRAELRWITRRHGLHLVYISDEGKDLGEGSSPQELTALGDKKPPKLVLWGEMTADGKFYEGRIPRLLKYPASAPEVATGKRLAVQIRRYELNWEGAPVRLYRCVKLVPAEE